MWKLLDAYKIHNTALKLTAIDTPLCFLLNTRTRQNIKISSFEFEFEMQILTESICETPD